MIIMLHRESIGLYKIYLGRVGEKGVIMKDQPKTEQLVRKFFWCQWDAMHQRLYYIHYRKRSETDKTNFQAILSSIQFYHNAKYDNITLSIEPPLFLLADLICLLFYFLLDPFLNVSVLTQPNGTFCICHQQLETPYSMDRKTPVKRTRKSPAQVTPSPLSLPSLSESDDDSVELNYYICMVHHGDYLMVLLPGHFVHLLNVGIEFEPCHHILLHDKNFKASISIASPSPKTGTATSGKSVSPSGSHDQSPGQQQSTSSHTEFSALSVLAEKMCTLSNACLYEIMRDMPTGGCLYNYKTGEIWKVILNLEVLISTFVSCYMPTSRLALLHYVVTRTRDFFLVKRLFEMISNDIASMEVPGLLAEFLIGTTYTTMRRQIERESLKLLPFTMSETFRGQFEKNIEGERVARISYSSLHTINIGTKTAKERQQKRGSFGEDMWDVLRRHLHWMQLEKYPRFSHKAVKRQIEKLLKDSQKSNLVGTRTTTSQDSSFLSSLHNHRKRSESPGPINPTFSNMRRVRPDTVLGQAPPFLQGNNITDTSAEIVAVTKNILTSHMNKYARKEVRLKGETVALEYVAAQIQQSRQLCHLLWTLRGPLLLHNDLNFLPTLTDPSTEDEYELYLLYQRYYQTCQELAYPIPLGFVPYFTALGYRNLSTCVFLQYVDQGILQLTGDFLAQVLADIPDDQAGVKIKQSIISRLPQPFAEGCYKEWNHPRCQRYFAHKQVSDALSAHDLSRNGITSNLEEYTPRNREIQDQMSHPASHTPGSTSVPIDFHCLEEVQYYLSGIDPKSTKQGIHNYIESKGAKILHLILFKPRSSFARMTAKVNVRPQDADLLDDDDFWSPGVRCRRWFSARAWEERCMRRNEDAYEDWGEITADD
ncbi:hypothetical protein FSP39_012649 [Pinctada imbricata]|uniref:Gamma-secretase-activating protein C-terminal domain-containing protein n=1 Tax=Pinctada imbricata TaxID=66713 RepID=A0AA88YD94_PINIB|nr:hypothetical protein FSP39_012649 [Pinctada imbricata]